MNAITPSIAQVGAAPAGAGNRTPAITTVCAIVVTFKPDFQQVRRQLEILMEQVDGIVIVDNSGDGLLFENLNSMLSTGQVITVDVGKNVGVANAHNLGIQKSREAGYSAVLLMDQDSLPAPGMVSRLAAAFNNMTLAGSKVGAVGPVCLDPRTNRFATFMAIACGRLIQIMPQAETVPVLWLVSSGTLISTSVLDDVGLMEGPLFIDQVDHEWCLRAASKGYQIFAIKGAVLEHNLGDSVRRVWFLRWRSAPMHSALRHYYMVRNMLLLSKRRYIPLECRRFFRTSIIFMVVFYSLYSADRITQLRKMITGIAHGLANRVGPYGGKKK